MKKKRMTPRRLQIILIVCIVFSIVLASVGFYFTKQFLSSIAVNVSHAISDSTASSNNVQTLQTIKKELAQEQSNEQKASEIVVPIGSYQSQVITDLDNYAAITGVSILDYTFTPSTTTATTSTAAATTPSGTQTVTVTIASPLPYNTLLEFIRAIESNLPKMIISNLTIGRSSTGSPGSVTVNTLTISVFTR